MEVRLVVQKGSTRAKAVRLHSEETIIGRRPDCDLRIKSSEVSRRHCLVSMHDGYLTVEDLDSVNGTFLNGERVTGKRVVQPGDHIEIGPLKFVVEYQMSTDARARLARGEAGEDFEVVEVEVVEAGASPFKFDSGEEVPFAEVEDETELVQSRSASDERIPVAEVEEIEEAELIVELDDDWHLPKSGDLKSLNPDLDKKPKKKR